jgi:uncharacterized repeat protein (TIGR03803 family)
MARLMLKSLDVTGREDSQSELDKRGRRRTALALAIGLLAFGTALKAQAQTTVVLYSFSPSNVSAGSNPQAGLVRDAAGNLFGTSAFGGANGGGAVFELVNSSGNYSAESLYSFSPNQMYAADPVVPALVMDASGNLYGAKSQGGTCGAGTVFELVNSAGNYTEKDLYSFGCHLGDGTSPSAVLALDAAGNLLGTTAGGGTHGAGTVFELVNSGGTYTEKVLYNFGGPSAGGPGADGANPFSSLLVDGDGNLYGTTNGGGTFGDGTVFELVNSSGSYTERILYSFGAFPGDGQYPAAGLMMDTSGNLFGTTFSGGMDNVGVVFELVNTSGTYTENILYSFRASGADGANPEAALFLDAAGNLYGTTPFGGLRTSHCSGGCGTVFELVNSSGTFTEKVLDRFGSFPGDGETPRAALIADAAGNLYGTTEEGGASGLGAVFVVNPSATGSVVTLSSSRVAFGPVPAGADATESVTATNFGNGDLVFGPGALTISGANAADFELTADNCSGETVAPNNNCSVSLTFSPSEIGAESATLTFTDNATNSPQEVALNATGAAAHDFTLGIAAGSSESAEVVEGSAATYMVDITPLGGFDQMVTLACSGAPYGAVCSINPSSLKLDGTSASAVKVTVTTLAARNVEDLGGSLLGGPGGRHNWPWLAVLAALGAMGLSVLWTARLRNLQPWLRWATLAALLLTVAISTACGPSGENLGIIPGTPAGTYTLTVTGSSPSGSTNLSHTISLTLKVDETPYWYPGGK